MPKMGESTLIRIPTSRARQLRALARARGTTMTGLIDELVTRAIAKSEIPDETPGLKFTRLPSGDLQIEIERERYIVSSMHAEVLFRWLGEDTTGASPQRALETFFGSLALRKAGTSLILEVKRSGRPAARFSMTGKISADVRRQIANAYKGDPWFRHHFSD